MRCVTHYTDGCRSGGVGVLVLLVLRTTQEGRRKLGKGVRRGKGQIGMVTLWCFIVYLFDKWHQPELSISYKCLICPPAPEEAGSGPRLLLG